MLTAASHALILIKIETIVSLSAAVKATLSLTSSCSYCWETGDICLLSTGEIHCPNGIKYHAIIWVPGKEVSKLNEVNG
jgi:hypothetical protein